jgi:hypothetical protein
MTEIVMEYLLPIECLTKLLQVSNLFSDSQNRTTISLTEAGFSLNLTSFGQIQWLEFFTTGNKKQATLLRQ